MVTGHWCCKYPSVVAAGERRVAPGPPLRGYRFPGLPHLFTDRVVVLDPAGIGVVERQASHPPDLLITTVRAAVGKKGGHRSRRADDDHHHPKRVHLVWS